MDDERLKRHDLIDGEWARLEPLLPSQNVHGAVEGPPDSGQRDLLPDRSGCAWRDLPQCYGRWKKVYNRHRRWALDGTWEKILRRGTGGLAHARPGHWPTRPAPPEPTAAICAGVM